MADTAPQSGPPESPAASERRPPAQDPQRSRIMAALSRVLPRAKTDPSPLSASRAPAADALTAANYVETHQAAPREPERLRDIPATAANALPDVPALHTYKGDVATTIERQRISLAAIAQAEAEKRAHEPPKAPARLWQRIGALRLVEIALGFLLIAAAIGALGWSYLRLKPLPPAPAPHAPFIAADQISAITAAPGDDRAALMDKLEQAARATLPVGIVEQLALSVASTTPGVQTPMTTRQFFSIAAPKAPDALVRSLDPQFLLGIYAADGNQPFLLFKTESYEQAFAAMLAWEYDMPRELSPLFPLPPAGFLPQATTSTSTPAPQVLTSPFTDDLIDNHNVRILRDADGNAALLWSFVDRQTLVITTTGSALTEIISRLEKAPTITLPGS